MNIRPRIRLSIMAAMLLVATLGSVRAGSAQVIDRIVATVNGSIILQSDWDQALCYEALLSHRPLSQFSADDRRAVLDRLIDQELLREQMKSADFRHATEAEASTRVAEAQKEYAQGSGTETWQSRLAQYHLTEQDVLQHVRQQIDLMRLVDARLRPTVQIDAKSIEEYYREKFVPHLKQTGAGAVPLETVSGKIRELLTEQKVNQLLVSWLQTLRSESQVRLPGITPPNEPGAQTP
ncbi:MAG TPA: SurA N-terminal domain-containing protein [Candidatus Aquilonibacter sp.]|nr:SurA N-terminal domain-containing protein [Candidatus Aquilonibacter sp.]